MYLICHFFAIVCILLWKLPFNVLKFQNLLFSVYETCLSGNRPYSPVIFSGELQPSSLATSVHLLRQPENNKPFRRQLFGEPFFRREPPFPSKNPSSFVSFELLPLPTPHSCPSVAFSQLRWKPSPLKNQNSKNYLQLV